MLLLLGSGNIDSILEHLSEKEAVIGVDNEVLESLSASLENAEIGVRKLVLCSRNGIWFP